MPTVATPIDERAKYQGTIEIDGLPALYAIKVTRPKITAITRTRGQAGTQMNIKLPTGGMQVEDLVLEKVVPGYSQDNWAWDLIMKSIDEPVNDAGFSFTFVEQDKNGDRIGSWDYYGCVIEVDPGDNDFEDKEAREVETVTIAIWGIEKP